MHFVALKTDVLFYCKLKGLARKWMQALQQGYIDLPVLSGIFTPNTNMFSKEFDADVQYPNPTDGLKEHWQV